jgi:hypothetical protein
LNPLRINKVKGESESRRKIDRACGRDEVR